MRCIWAAEVWGNKTDDLLWKNTAAKRRILNDTNTYVTKAILEPSGIRNSASSRRRLNKVLLLIFINICKEVACISCRLCVTAQRGTAISLAWWWRRNCVKVDIIISVTDLCGSPSIATWISHEEREGTALTSWWIKNMNGWKEGG